MVADIRMNTTFVAVIPCVMKNNWGLHKTEQKIRLEEASTACPFAHDSSM
jgi:hypothetical protein